MKHDVTELKKMFLEVLKGDHANQTILNQHKEFFREVQSENSLSAPRKEIPVIFEANNSGNNSILSLPTESLDEDFERIEDITHEEEDETLSIEKKEKELILRALFKNKNKRKYAAQDLGISERTLYRKIKQYEIEEQ